MSRTRTLTAGLAAAVLLTAAAVPAAAAETTHAATASSAGLTLSLAGTDLLEVASTGAAAVPGEATAFAVPVALGGSPVGDRQASSDGPVVADPSDGSDRCLAAIPSPLSALVGAGLACSDATAVGDDATATATAGVAELSVLDLQGGELSAVTDLLATLPLDAILAPVEDQLLGQLEGVFGDVREQCLDALAPLNVAGLLDPVLDPLATALPGELGALLTTVDDLLGGLLPTACDVLGDLADTLLGGDLLGSITDGDLLAGLAGAEGLLTVTLLETGSAVAADGTTVTATSGPADDGAIAITLDVPLLEDLLGGVLEDAIAPLLSEVSALLAPLGDAVGGLPVLGDLVGPLLSTGDLGDLVTGPLLSVGVVPGTATATGDLTSGDTDGTATPAIVALDGALFTLPVLGGLDEALDEVARVLDDTLLSQLRATPLVDLVSVELLPESVTATDVSGLAGTEATAGAASVQVLSVIGDPLLDLEAAPALAAVGVGETDTPVTPSGPDPEEPEAPATPTERQLPVTGGGAALLGLAALGSAASLRRRG